MNNNIIDHYQIGDEIPSLITKPISRSMLALYAGASGDHNPIHIDIDFAIDEKKTSIRCYSHVETEGKTGVEMEALTAVQITLLTIYDMCKAIDRGMTISNIQLSEKSGGKSGHWKRHT